MTTRSSISCPSTLHSNLYKSLSSWVPILGVRKWFPFLENGNHFLTPTWVDFLRVLLFKVFYAWFGDQILTPSMGANFLKYVTPISGTKSDPQNWDPSSTFFWPVSVTYRTLLESIL